MKKTILLTLVALCCSVSFAQNFKAGLIGGVVSTDVLGTDIIDNDVDYYKVGFNLGLFAQLPISDRSDVEFEMYFIQKGTYSPFQTDTSGAPIPGSHSYKLRLNYMEVPLLYSHRLSFNIGKKQINRLAFEIGPSFGFLVYSGEEFDNNGFQPVVVTGGFQPFHSLDISGLIGLIYSIDEHWKFHIRYENSLIAIRPHASGATGWNPVGLYYNPGQVNMLFNYVISFTFGKGTEAPPSTTEPNQ